jgi:hypothetical protein
MRSSRQHGIRLSLMLVVVSLVLWAAGCAGNPKVECKRAEWWDNGEVTYGYGSALYETFGFDPLTGFPVQNAVIFRRLWYLEGVCVSLTGSH